MVFCCLDQQAPMNQLGHSLGSRIVGSFRAQDRHSTLCQCEVSDQVSQSSFRSCLSQIPATTALGWFVLVQPREPYQSSGNHVARPVSLGPGDATAPPDLISLANVLMMLPIEPADICCVYGLRGHGHEVGSACRPVTATDQIRTVALHQIEECWVHLIQILSGINRHAALLLHTLVAQAK
jgi:hypothetical protein